MLEVQRVEENFIWFKSQRFLQGGKEAFYRLSGDAIDKIHIDAGKAKGFQQRQGFSCLSGLVLPSERLEFLIAEALYPHADPGGACLL